MEQIHWNAQIISVMGPKGVGKSTLIKQHIKQNYQPGDRRVLYCSADTIDFSTRTLVELAEEFHIHGGELLVIDEIHKYKPGTMDWSREVKEIYENMFTESEIKKILSLPTRDFEKAFVQLPITARNTIISIFASQIENGTFEQWGKTKIIDKITGTRFDLKI